MVRRGVRLILICEDGEHERFARYTFLGLGFNRRELRFFVSPSGRGAAEQWVRKRYAPEVRTYRGKASYQHVGLAVIMDADRRKVSQREEQLAAELADVGEPARETHERILHWIPRRHIETWVAFLRGRDVDEEMDCKSLVGNSDYRPAAESFVQIYREATPRPAQLLESLSLALEEAARLEEQAS